MDDELSDDQRIIRRGRRIGAAALAAMFLGCLGLVAMGITTGRPSPATVQAALVGVGVVAALGLAASAMWLLLGQPGRASEVRLGEALRLLTLAPALLLMALGESVTAWVGRPHPALAEALQVLCLVGMLVFFCLVGVVQRRYPVMPKDVPINVPGQPVRSWAGWYVDYDDRRLLRYWDGAQWTDQVRERGAPG